MWKSKVLCQEESSEVLLYQQSEVKGYDPVWKADATQACCGLLLRP